jgi:hypothetical protein
MATHYGEGITIHCESAGGNDFTLCGYSLDGERGDDLLISTRLPINCPTCIGIINFCRRLRTDEVCSYKSRRD